MIVKSTCATFREWMLLSQYFTDEGFVIWGLKEKGHSCNTHNLLLLSWNSWVCHLGIRYKTISAVYLAGLDRLTKKTRRLKTRTFQEVSHSYMYMKFGMRLREIPITDWVTYCRHIPKITFKCIFKLFCHIYVMPRKHALETQWIMM